MTSSTLVDCWTGKSAGLAENPTGIDARQMVHIRNTAAIAYQAAGLDELPAIENRGYRMALRQIDQLIALAEKRRICVDKKPSGLLFY